MTAVGHVPILFAAVTVTATLLVLPTGGKHEPDGECDGKEWHEGDGNHVYYDRKPIRRKRKVG